MFALTAAAFGREEEARLVDAIRASDRYVAELSLVAVDSGEIVGHVMLSYVDLDGRDVLQLSPLSVAPDRQGQGIGCALSRKALRLADKRGEPLVVVSVIRRTTRASASAPLRASALSRLTRRGPTRHSWWSRWARTTRRSAAG